MALRLSLAPDGSLKSAAHGSTRRLGRLKKRSQLQDLGALVLTTRAARSFAKPAMAAQAQCKGRLVDRSFPDRSVASQAILVRLLARPRPKGLRLAEEGKWRRACSGRQSAGADTSSNEASEPSDVSVSVSPPPTQYKDSTLDLAFLAACRQAFGRVAGWQSPRPWAENYLGMVEVSHALMRGRTAKQQQQAVLQGFPSVPPSFRALFPYSDWGAEINARITPAFFTWLVGPCHVAEAEITVPGKPGDPPSKKLLKSAVKIDKCRYLETSGCVGMCVNLCKVPTQYFFSEELGMPLTMEPNFEDLSCRMVFGQVPPPLDQDPALSQRCFQSCPTGNSKALACPKLT